MIELFCVVLSFFDHFHIMSSLAMMHDDDHRDHRDHHDDVHVVTEGGERYVARP